MAATANKKRPRLDMNTDPRERKRGKSMFGLVLGTLNKAKVEDKERNASEAAKKRQLIEKKLQEKLRKETDSVRRAEETKKDKTLAARKEEELQLKDSIYKLRRKRLPLLANFLLTSDVIRDSPDDVGSKTDAMDTDADADPAKILTQAQAPRSHPPPLYYLPAILTPSQNAFLDKRKTEVSKAADQEWEAFAAERAAGIVEIERLRQKVAQEAEELRKAQAEKADAQAEKGDTAGNTKAGEDSKPEVKVETTTTDVQMEEPPPTSAMDVDDAKGNGVEDARGASAKDTAREGDAVREKAEQETQDKAAKMKEEQMSAQMRADDDDAVEY